MSEMTDTQTNALPEAVPFDMLSKDEMWKHLRSSHKTPYFLNSKTTKDDLVTWHSRDGHGPNGHLAIREDRKHIHTAITVEGGSFDRTSGLTLTKPLTTSEARSLKSLVDNDFDALASEMQQMAADKQREAIEGVDKEWSLKKDRRAEYIDRATKALREMEVLVSSLVEQARADGITLSINTRYYNAPGAELVGKDQAIKKAREDISTDLNRAQMALHRQRLTAQRQILMASVTPEATAILKTIPTANDLMVQAATQRSSITA